MKRLHRILVTTPLGLLLVCAVACSSNVAGSGKGAFPTSDQPTAPAATAVVTSSAASTPPTSAPVAATTPVATTVKKTTPAPSKPAAPQFLALSLTTDHPCGQFTGYPEVDAILTWKVANATGIEVNIDNSSESGASPYPSVSGTEQLTSIACGTGQTYTFDIWTLGGAAGQQAHRTLSYMSAKF